MAYKTYSKFCRENAKSNVMQKAMYCDYYYTLMTYINSSTALLRVSNH